jgi:hypothetical protein
LRRPLDPAHCFPRHSRRRFSLNGKVNAEALHALKDKALDHYLRKANLDFIMLHDFDVAFFDERLPACREMFARQATSR